MGKSGFLLGKLTISMAIFNGIRTMFLSPKLPDLFDATALQTRPGSHVRIKGEGATGAMWGTVTGRELCLVYTYSCWVSGEYIYNWICL